MTESHNGQDMEAIAKADTAKKMTPVKGSGARRARAWLEDHARRTRDLMGGPPIIDRGTYARQQRARQPWATDDLIPDEVVARERARGWRKIDPMSLVVPDRYLGREHVDEVIDHIRTATLAHYGPQEIRIQNAERRRARASEENRKHIAVPQREQTLQQAFESGVAFFADTIGTIEQIRGDVPGGIILLAYDADDTWIKVSEEAGIIKAWGLEKIPIRKLDDSQHRRLADKHLKDSYSRVVINPVAPITADYIRRTYPDEVIQFFLTTKEQRGLNEHFKDIIRKACKDPETFPEWAFMSSRDGAAVRIVPQLIDIRGPEDRRGNRANDITMEEALAAINIPAADKGILMDRLVKDLGSKWDPKQSGMLSDYETKFFMIGMILGILRTEGLAGLKRILTEDADQVSAHMGRIKYALGHWPPSDAADAQIPQSEREATFVMVDDGVKPALHPHSNARYVQVNRFRALDDPDEAEDVI
jgi:hypothetical protein